MKKVILIVAAAAALTVLVLLLVPGLRPSGATVHGAAAMPGTATRVTLVGTIEARQADAMTEVPGRIVRLLVDEGSGVRRGEVVAELDAREASDRVAEARGQLTVAQAQLQDLLSLPRAEDVAVARSQVSEAEVALAKAREDLARAQRLRKEDVLPQRDFDDARSAFQSAQQRVATTRRVLAQTRLGARPGQVLVARRQVAELTHTVDRARLDVERGRVRAPINGTVLQKNFEQGEITTAGSRLFTVEDLSQMWVEIMADEQLHGRLVLGQPAAIQAETFPHGPVRGRVTFIADRHAFTPRDVQTRDERTRLSYRVKVSVASPPAFLKPGMFVNVTFDVQEARL